MTKNWINLENELLRERDAHIKTQTDLEIALDELVQFHEMITSFARNYMHIHNDADRRRRKLDSGD